MPLISIHLPKTGGTSFKQVLDSRFGTALLNDYGDVPLNTPRPQRELAAFRHAARLAWTGLPATVECVHGHFLPLKYRSLGRRAVFVTWLRDPVERLVSHYRYWMRTGTVEHLLPLHRRMMEQEWDLERFCLGPELRNTYRQFLFGFPRRRLDFVGITERSERDFSIFCRRYLGGEALQALPQANVGDTAGERHLADGPLRKRIEAWHARDVALYQYFLARPPQ